MTLKKLLIHLLTCFSLSCGKRVPIDPNAITATNHQLVIRSADGGILMGTDSGTHYRAEQRSKDNEVKGVYSWLDPRGQPHTTAFNSGPFGYKTMSLPQAGIVLPPFPYSLYGNRPERLESRSKKGEKDDDFVVITSPTEEEIDEPEEITTEESTTEKPASVIDLVEDNKDHKPENGPFAASKPWAAAVAGPNGTAIVNPSSQAFVGPGGVAISLPTAEASVGLGGVAISRPVSSSNAGHGGVAIAGGLSVASSGLTYDSKAQAKAEGNVVILPIVANYYYGLPMAAPALPHYPRKFSARPRPSYFYNSNQDDEEKFEYSARTYEDFKQNSF